MTSTERAPVVLVVDSNRKEFTRIRTAIEAVVSDVSVVHAEAGTLECTKTVEERVDCVVVD